MEMHANPAIIGYIPRCSPERIVASLDWDLGPEETARDTPLQAHTNLDPERSEA